MLVLSMAGPSKGTASSLLFLFQFVVLRSNLCPCPILGLDSKLVLEEKEWPCVSVISCLLSLFSEQYR